MKREVVFHACCAPCASVGIPRLLVEDYDITVYFYGCNIHPEKEWELRLRALHTLTASHGVKLIACHYDPEEWFFAVKGFENEPEGGERCRICMKLQLQKSAAYAVKNGFDLLCTSLTLSPQKHPQLINHWGTEIAQSCGLSWLERIWRKNDGFLYSLQESRRLSLYRQHYCGCVFSLNSRKGGNADYRT